MDRDETVHPPMHADVEVSLAWTGPAQDRGVLTVLNLGPRVVRLDGKPDVVPVDLDPAVAGRRAVTLEFVDPGHVDVPPGRRATAEVYLGAEAGDAFLVQLGRYGDAGTLHRVVVSGAARSSSGGPPYDVTQQWFRLVDEFP